MNRRQFFLSSIVGGSATLLATSVFMAEAANSPVNSTPTSLVPLGESLIIYTDLLADIFQQAIGAELDATVDQINKARSDFDKLQGAAESLNAKYQDRSNSSSSQEMLDLFSLVDSISTSKLSSELQTIFDAKTDIRAHQETFDEIRRSMFAAYEALSPSRTQNASEIATAVGKAKKNIDIAISDLNWLALLEDPLHINTAQGPSHAGAGGGNVSWAPLDQFQALLESVKRSLDAVYHPAKIKTALFTEGPQEAAVFAEYRLGAGIKKILIEHIRPGSIIQLAVGYAVVVPVILGNPNVPGDLTIRKRLLTDVLRLIPGFTLPAEDLIQALASYQLSG